MGKTWLDEVFPMILTQQGYLLNHVITLDL